MQSSVKQVYWPVPVYTQPAPIIPLLAYCPPCSSPIPFPYTFLHKFCIVPQSPSGIPRLHILLVSPFLSLMKSRRTWTLSSPKLCMEFFNGPSMTDWRLLVLGLVSIIPSSPGLCLCVGFFVASLCTYYLLLH